MHANLKSGHTDEWISEVEVALDASALIFSPANWAIWTYL